MRAILTGATGFIGFALLKHLLLEGHEVTTVLRPGTGKKGKIESFVKDNPDVAKRLTVYEVSLEELESLASEHHVEADAFYHLAWNGSSGADRENFEMQYSNIGYTANAIRAAKACGCKRFVGAGSQAEYGVVKGTAYEDKTVTNPFMMYGAAKVAACKMGTVLAGQIGIEFVWPRIYSVYGVGENSGTLVNYVIDTLKEGKTPELSPCENTWNFLYISDCVRMLAVLGTSDKVTSGIYHIASEDTRVLKNFVEEIRDIVASGATLAFGAKEGNPQRTFQLDPDVSKIMAVSGPCEVSFAEGIKRKISQ